MGWADAGRNSGRGRRPKRGRRKAGHFGDVLVRPRRSVPLALTWMAWQAARIRSTQSATGILYVVVLLSFLGELTGQLLRDTTGISL